MADNRTAKANPRIVDIGSGRKITVPTYTTTWKAGEFLVGSANGVIPVATDGGVVTYLACEDVTSPTQGDRADVILLASDTILEVFGSDESGGNDIDDYGAAANVGTAYAVKVGSNYHTIDFSNTTTANAPLVVVDYAANYNAAQYTATTSPAPVFVTVKADHLST